MAVDMTPTPTSDNIRFRSGLERSIAQSIESRGFPLEYETDRIEYVWPAQVSRYTPDFKLPNGIYIEAKGIFDTEDRKKQLLVREQHPELDIRIVFSNSKNPIGKGSRTTYAAWCEKHGIPYADRTIPACWFDEPPKTRH